MENLCIRDGPRWLGWALGWLLLYWHPFWSSLQRLGPFLLLACLASRRLGVDGTIRVEKMRFFLVQDLVAGFGGSQRGRTDGLFADTGQQGDIITGETQILLDARAMHVKLSEDLSALDRIIGKGVPERTSSLLKSSAAARIIAKADQVRAEASKLVGAKKGHRNQGLTLGGTSKTAELQLALSTAKKSTTSKQIKGAVVQSRAVGNPFAHGEFVCV